MDRGLARITLAAGLSVIGLLAIAAPASADTVTIGSNLTAAPNSNTCTGLCTAVQQSQAAGSPNPLTSPATGTVTQWAFRATDSGALLSFRILRPVGTNTYFGAGTAAAPAPDSGNGQIVRYPVSLPIKQGDAIGISGAGDLDAGLPQHDTPGVLSNVWATNSLGQPNDGASAAFAPESGHELLLQATIKFCNVPSLIGKLEAVATSEITAADCTSTKTTQDLQLRAIKKRFSKKKKKKIRAANKALQAQNGKVLGQSIAAGTTQASPGTPVALTIGQVVKPPKQKKKKHHH